MANFRRYFSMRPALRTASIWAFSGLFGCVSLFGQGWHSLVGEYHGASAWLPIPPLGRLIHLHEQAAALVHPSRVIGVALMTYDLPEAAAREAVRRAAAETGLPVTDPVRFGAAPLVEAIRAAAASRRAARPPAPA